MKDFFRFVKSSFQMSVLVFMVIPLIIVAMALLFLIELNKPNDRKVFEEKILNAKCEKRKVVSNKLTPHEVDAARFTYSIFHDIPIKCKENLEMNFNEEYKAVKAYSVVGDFLTTDKDPYLLSDCITTTVITEATKK